MQTKKKLLSFMDLREPLKLAHYTPSEIVPFDPHDWQSVVRYFWHHKFQVLLLILIGVMVYVIDHLSNVNALLYSAAAIPGLSTTVAGPSASQSSASVVRRKRRRS